MEQTTVDDLSPGARHLYDLLVGGSASSTSAASPLASSWASPTGRSPASAPEKDLHSMTPSTCSTVCLGADAAISPEAQAIYQLLIADQSVYEKQFAEYAEKYHASSCRRSGDLVARVPAQVATHVDVAGNTTSAASSAVAAGGVLSAPPSTTTPIAPATVLNVAPVAVDINATDLGTAVPTSCSSACPSHDAAVPLSVIISSAIPNSPTTTWAVLPELATPAVSDKALHVDVVGDTSQADTICLPADLDEEEVRVDVSLILGSVLASFVPSQVFEAMAPDTCLIYCSNEDTYVLMPKFNRVLRPWPFFKCSQFWTSSVRMSWVFQRLQPPWPPPELEILGWHMKETVKSLAHRLETVGRIILHPVHKLVSSPSSITDNETTGPYAKLFLDDVLWKRPRWWSNIQCIRPTNSIPDMFSWLWITGKHAEVQLQFSYPLFPVTCHFVRVHFLLSRRAQVNVESNSGTSLNLVVYCGYPALNIAHTHYWMLIIVGHLQYCLEEADALLLQNSWLPEPYLQLFLGQPCAVQMFTSSSVVRKYLSSNIFLAILNGEAEVQQRCSCPRVLTAVVCKGWIHCLNLQGITQYSELISWSISETLLQSGLGFHATGDVCFFWKHLWIINLVSLQLWFQYCSAGRESLHGCEDFEWTIAWFLSYHFPLPTLHTHKIYSARLSSWKEALTVLNQWTLKSCNLYVWNSVDMELVLDSYDSTCLTGQLIQRTYFLVQWKIPWTILLVPLKFRFQYYHAQPEIMYSFKSFQWSIAWSLGYQPYQSSLSSIQIGAICVILLDQRLLFRYMMGKLTDAIVLHMIFLGKHSTEDVEPCLLSCAPSYRFDCFQWEIAWFLVDATLTYITPRGMYQSLSLECSYVIYYYMEMEKRSLAGYSIYVLCLPWDPSACCAYAWRQGSPDRVNYDCSWPGIDTSQVPWDPGGSTRDRLVGKPNFKRGGLSATCLHELAHGPPPWARACLEPDAEGTAKLIYLQSSHKETRLGTNGRTASAWKARIG